MLWKLLVFGERPETFESPRTRVPHSSRSARLPEVLREGEGGAQRPLGTSMRGPYHGFCEGVLGKLPSPLEGTFSKTIISVMPDLLSKVWGFRKRPSTFAIAPAQVLHSSRSSGLAGVLCSWGGSKAPLAAASWGTLPGSSLRGSGKASDPPRE